MLISTDQWRAVVGSNSVRRPCQVVSIEQLLLNKLTKTLSQQNGVDTTLGTPEDAAEPSIPPETMCAPKGYYCGTPYNDKTATVVQMMLSTVSQVLQSFVSMVALSLLILSGDVETNPGPTGKDTPEYRTIVACTATIKNNLAQGASGISDTLFSKGVISDETRYAITHASTGRDKADILLQAVTDGIAANSEVFREFVSAVKNSGPWTDDMVRYIMGEYEKEKRKVQKPKPSAGRQRSDVNEDIDAIARRHGLTPDQLDVPCAKGHLLPISHLIANWKAYACYLGLSDLEEKYIQRDISLTSPHQRPEEMLKMWLKQTSDTPHCHYRRLLRACIEIETNRLLAGQICDVIKEMPPIDPVTSPTTVALQETSTPQQQVNVTGSDEASPPHKQPPKGSEPKFCVPAPFKPPPLKKAAAAPDGAQHGQADMGKLWPPGSVLLVYIINPEALKKYGYNSENVLGWAEKWEAEGHPVPKFEETDIRGEAHIRVWIADKGGSWSMIGTDAKTITKLSEPTMTLQLVEGHRKYNKHTAIHEFGHALGLEHEHQRSKFWSVADDLIDKEKMKKDPQLKNTDIQGSYLEVKQIGVGTPEYDPDSVMHYWFDEGWLRDSLDPRTLSKDREKVYKGIKRRHDNRYVQKPSKMDIKFVRKCYGAPAVNEGNPAASQLQTASGKSQGHPAAQMGPIMSGNVGPFTPPPTKAAAATSPKIDFETLLQNIKGLTEEELDEVQIEEHDLDNLARLLGDVDSYIDRLSLFPGEKADVNREQSNIKAMKLALKYWKAHHHFDASFKRLLLIVLELPGQGQIASGICDYYMTNRQDRQVSPPIVPKPESRPHDCNGQTIAPPVNNQEHVPKTEIVSKGYQKTGGSYPDKPTPQQPLLPSQTEDVAPTEECTQISQAGGEIVLHQHGRQSPEQLDQLTSSQQQGAAHLSQQESTDDNQSGSQLNKLIISRSEDWFAGPDSIQERDPTGTEVVAAMDPETGETNGTSPPHISRPSLNSLADAETDAPATAPAPIRIGVVGTTKSGKSTTLNALLQGEFLPSSSSGATTAHILCIKHDPSTPEGKLYNVATDPDRCNPIVTGEKEILQYLKKFNKEIRKKSPEEAASLICATKLELRVKMPFLKEYVNLELYDTPGTCEEKDSPVYKVALSEQLKMDGHILVLGLDNVQLEKPSDLLKRLRDRLPRMKTLHRGYIPLGNKYDVLFEEPEDLEEKLEDICEHIEILRDEIIVYSAWLGLKARTWQDSSDIEGRQCDLTNRVRKMLTKEKQKKEDFTESLAAKPSLEEKMVVLSEAAETTSRIGEVEKAILNFLQKQTSIKQ